MGIKVSNTKELRIIANGCEICIRATPAKVQNLTDILLTLDTPATCVGTYQLNKEQYEEFVKQSSGILYL